MKIINPGKNAFKPVMAETMGGFQKPNPSDVWNMKKFMDLKEWQGLKEEELFYRATDYRGSQ